MTVNKLKATYDINLLLDSFDFFKKYLIGELEFYFKTDLVGQITDQRDIFLFIESNRRIFCLEQNFSCINYFPPDKDEVEVSNAIKVSYVPLSECKGKINNLFNITKEDSIFFSVPTNKVDVTFKEETDEEYILGKLKVSKNEKFIEQYRTSLIMPFTMHHNMDSKKIILDILDNKRDFSIEK